MVQGAEINLEQQRLYFRYSSRFPHNLSQIVPSKCYTMWFKLVLVTKTSLTYRFSTILKSVHFCAVLQFCQKKWFNIFLSVVNSKRTRCPTLGQSLYRCILFQGHGWYRLLHLCIGYSTPTQHINSGTDSSTFILDIELLHNISVQVQTHPPTN